MNANRFPLLALAAALLAPAAVHAQFSQPVRNVENPSQNAYTIRGNFNIASPANQNATFTAEAPPPLKRFTVESLGLRCLVDSDVTAVNATVTFRMRNSPNENPFTAVLPIVMVRQGLNGAFVAWYGTLNGRAFHDNAGSTEGPVFSVNRTPVGGPLACGYTIMGGLTNLPQ